MPDDISLQVIGGDELKRILRQSTDVGLKTAVKQANKTAAEVVARRALPLVPVRSGALKASVRALGQQAKANVRAGSARVPYAAAVHWGRKSRGGGARGHPFLWDAMNQALRSGELERTYSDACTDLLDRLF